MSVTKAAACGHMLRGASTSGVISCLDCGEILFRYQAPDPRDERIAALERVEAAARAYREAEQKRMDAHDAHLRTLNATTAKAHLLQLIDAERAMSVARDALDAALARKDDGDHD